MWRNSYYKTRKDLVGKDVAWDVLIDVFRGVYKTETGTVSDVKGRNVFFSDGSTGWLPSMENVRPADHKSPWAE